MMMYGETFTAATLQNTSYGRGKKKTQFISNVEVSNMTRHSGEPN